MKRFCTRSKDGFNSKFQIKSVVVVNIIVYSLIKALIKTHFYLSVTKVYKEQKWTPLWNVLGNSATILFFAFFLSFIVSPATHIEQCFKIGNTLETFFLFPRYFLVKNCVFLTEINWVKNQSKSFPFIIFFSFSINQYQ